MSLFVSRVFVLRLLVLFVGYTTSAVTLNGNVAKEAEAASGGDVILAKPNVGPGLAVDGARSTQLCFQLTGNDPTLTVQLTSAVDVSFILVFTGASNDGLSLHDSPGGVEVSVETTPCSDQSYSRREMLSAVCSTPVHGSRVTIRLPGPNRTASLCEVEVYDTSCDCLEGCHANQGFCFGPCPRDVCNRENVALSKPTRSSPLTGISGPPSVVVDGNTGTTFISEKVTSDAREQNCIASKARTTLILNEEAETLLTREKRMAILPEYVVPWWSVDLQSDVPVRGVVIYRSNPAQVWETGTVTKITVDGVMCATYGPDTHPQEEATRERLVVKCDEVVRGREVKIARVQVSKSVDPAPLGLCEVEIWNCRPGWYADDCSRTCGHCAGGSTTCDPVSGQCPAGCEDGWFGSTCESQCVTSCVNGVCHQDTGHCLQCPPRFALPFCTECSDGWYGSTCTEPCGHCVNSAACDVTTGHCVDGCAPGFLPPLCVDVAEITTTTYNTATNATSNNSNDGGDGGGDAGVIVGAVFGVLAVVVVVFVIVALWYRRRRRDRDTKENPVALPSVAGAIVYTKKEKPAVAKAESSPYTDAVSSDTGPQGDVIGDAEDPTYDVINETCYESLKVQHYENLKLDHDYVTPVFKRGESQTSNDSGAYVDMGAT